MTARLRWTEPALDDFLGIVAWIKLHIAKAADHVGRRILKTVDDLALHPYLGKPGRVPDTRELVVTRFPYLIIYKVEAAADAQTVSVLRVLHGAMLWPPDDAPQSRRSSA